MLSKKSKIEGPEKLANGDFWTTRPLQCFVVLIRRSVSGDLHHLAFSTTGKTCRGSAAASRADELTLKMRQPHVIGPSIAADRDEMTTLVIGAIDQEARTPDKRVSANVI
jgi:hypothetical protein